MTEESKAFYRKMAEKGRILGADHTLGVIQALCEATAVTAEEKIEEIRYLLRQCDLILLQVKEG